jgi:hypothetical protein
VNDALVQVVLLNEIYAVGTLLELLPDVGDTLIVNVLPPAVYPAPTTSLDVVYIVVVGPILAAAVYRAILKVFGDVGPKL